jgi:HPt (histidine-containing phosphotransfer) domain-containing protein
MTDRVLREEALRRRMQELAGQFLTRTEGEVTQIRSMVEGRNVDDVALEPLIMLAHKICGTASTFQFDAISACAAELESLASALSTAGRLEASGVEHLSRLASRLSQAVEHSRRTAVPPQ